MKPGCQPSHSALLGIAAALVLGGLMHAGVASPVSLSLPDSSDTLPPHPLTHTATEIERMCVCVCVCVTHARVGLQGGSGSRRSAAQCRWNRWTA
jgi:hypothetical protein